MTALKDDDLKISSERSIRNEAVVRIDKLSKSFGTQTVLNDINLELQRGENLVILGRSGTGKSVLIKCMVGLVIPNAGNIWVLGKNIPSLNKPELRLMRRKIGFSFQGGALYDSMTVRQNLEFPLKRNLGIFDPKMLEKMVVEALEDVGLGKGIDLLPSELSGGMKKRVGIARTLILKPEIMLYDEPTSGLDPVTSIEIIQLINEMRAKYNTSSIIITHDIACAKATADRMVFLANGVLKLEGSYHILEQSNDPELKPFFDY